MTTEPLIVHHDPEGPAWRPAPVVATIEVPDRATSNGWGDMSWTKR